MKVGDKVKIINKHFPSTPNYGYLVKDDGSSKLNLKVRYLDSENWDYYNREDLKVVNNINTIEVGDSVEIIERGGRLSAFNAGDVVTIRFISNDNPIWYGLLDIPTRRIDEVNKSCIRKINTSNDLNIGDKVRHIKSPIGKSYSTEDMRYDEEFFITDMRNSNKYPLEQRNLIEGSNGHCYHPSELEIIG